MDVILISGTSRGLGHALALQYLKERCLVIGIARGETPIRDKNYVHLAADITDSGFQQQLESLLAKRLIRAINLVINNGGSAGQGDHLSQLEPDDVLAQVNLHCVGALRVIKAAKKYLRKAKIVNVSSRLGSIVQTVRGDFATRDFSYGYRIGKCAQNMLSLCLQGDEELAGTVIISINPGLLLTDLGASDASHSAEDGARAFIEVVRNADHSGMYHAFGDEALY
ncbi:MAG: SDR family NAD(P)-dependent oxidoreductase [Thermodesulfobacteriota bacterium]